MASSEPQNLPDQAFPDAERLLRRVRRNNLRPDGRATPMAFELPDMSVNRERYSSDEEARKGFHSWDWGVVAFFVGDIPPRESWVHVAQLYRLVPRHAPIRGNFSHTEVRVWRADGEQSVLITYRGLADFEATDPDRESPLGSPSDLLDPDFHMRWRKHISLASKPVLGLANPPAEEPVA